MKELDESMSALKNYFFAGMLTELRKEAHRTQTEVAKALSIPRSTLANWEQGTREPSYDSLNKIASFYGVSVDYLLGREERTEDDMSPNTRILLQTLRGATEDEIAQAIKIVEALKK